MSLFVKISLLILVILLVLLVDENGIITEITAIKQQILWQVRLPRIITALACGGALALAGVLLQALLKNPLADPFVLGVGGGGSVAALLVMLYGLAGIWVLIGSFTGALLSLMLVFFLAQKNQTGFAFRLILSGIVMASLWGALVNLILIISPNHKIPSMLFWLMGDLTSLNIPWYLIIALFISVSFSWFFARHIDLLLYDEAKAQSLGLNLVKIQWFMLIISSLLVAGVVSVAGNIGFVGLVVPHIVRLFGNRNHRKLIPNAVFFGAIMLVIADWLSRVVVAPAIVPVGIFTTIIGVPIFIYLLRKTNV